MVGAKRQFLPKNKRSTKIDLLINTGGQKYELSFLFSFCLARPIRAVHFLARPLFQKNVFWPVPKRSPVIEILDKNQQFAQQTIILVNNKHFSQKSPILVKNRDFDQKSPILSKINLSIKNGHFGPKSIFWSKIDILVKNPNFHQKSSFWSKIEILVKNRHFGEK